MPFATISIGPPKSVHNKGRCSMPKNPKSGKALQTRSPFPITDPNHSNVELVSFVGSSVLVRYVDPQVYAEKLRRQKQLRKSFDAFNQQ
jgi:hypothetical protein